MLKKLKQRLSQKSQSNANKLAKIEQMKHLGILVAILACSFAFYRLSETQSIKTTKQDELKFDGVFDSGFNQGSDEALIAKQQSQIDEIKARVKKNEKNQSNDLPSETKELLQSMQKQLKDLEAQNQKTNEQLQVALLQNAQRSAVVQPPTREEMAARLKQKQQAERELYSHAGLETVHFRASKKTKFEKHTANNYVWAGTFVEGVLLTGIIGDAGINGSKNMGTAMIRLTSNGIMPNEQRSRLEGCFVLVSSYGDLSGSSVVLHVETLSCAGKSINFEQKAYGSVFDLDAMQDLRGTSILKTKPLLSYTAAAGALAGIGDGLKNYGVAQTVNPGAGTVTMYGTGQAIAQSAAGGALSNPANRISDYVMRIADIYHPLVVARAGRRVSVLFTKGFWIDKEHQVYESGKAIDESHAQNEPSVVTTVSEVNAEEPQAVTSPVGISLNRPETSFQGGLPSEQEFIQQQALTRMPTVSDVKEPSHD
jgi:conjugal transfer pilus assembly protein TraB